MLPYISSSKILIHLYLNYKKRPAKNSKKQYLFIGFDAARLQCTLLSGN